MLAGCASNGSLGPGPSGSAVPLLAPAAAPSPTLADRGSAPAGSSGEYFAPQDPQDKAAPQGQEPWGSDKTRSYIIPAVEIVSFEVALNAFDRHFNSEKEVYQTNGESIHDNLSFHWQLDKDPFAVNQLLHPYTGSIYHGFARSAGLEFWPAFAYTFAGSALWEIAGETDPPSINDQIHTGIGGAFLGEALFRTASWLLEVPEKPDLAHRLGALALSPTMAFNRWVFGDRFDGVYPSHDPAVFSRIGGGVKIDLHRGQTGLDEVTKETSAAAQFVVDYGLPGKAGYNYDRPFDYFHFDVTGLIENNNHVDRAVVRGLLFGTEYDNGDSGHGVYGFFGGYDYRSPGLFRVASTAVHYGNVGEAPLWSEANLQWTALGGVGFGAAGTVSDDSENRDYHHGVIPQVGIDFRLMQSEFAMLQLTGNDYFVWGVGSNDINGHENVIMAELSLTMRIAGPHALRVEFTTARRDSSFDVEDDRHQKVNSVFLLYNFLGGTRFTAVH